MPLELIQKREHLCGSIYCQLTYLGFHFLFLVQCRFHIYHPQKCIDPTKHLIDLRSLQKHPSMVFHVEMFLQEQSDISLYWSNSNTAICYFVPL